jgi:hypothetical protein
MYQARLRETVLNAAVYSTSAAKHEGIDHSCS